MAEDPAEVAQKFIDRETAGKDVVPVQSANPAAPSNVPASILASAVRVTSRSVDSNAFKKNTHETWQDDAWAMFDLVGELRFLATTMAQRTSKARMYIGKLSQDPSEDPVLVTDDQAPGLPAILEAVGDGHLGLSQIIERCTANLFITGDCWLVGIPRDVLDYRNSDLLSTEPAPSSPEPTKVNRAAPTPQPENGADISMLDELDWRLLSITEIKFFQGGEVKLYLGPTPKEQITISPNDLYLVRIWRSHPRWWWQADSPVRSSLPVLRELVGLTMHISSQIDSRLAGAGMLLVPESASRALKQAANLQPESEEDPFTEALIDAMLTPIGDRSNASALVPLVVTVPDETAKLFSYMTFAKPLDTEAKVLRDEAIRRLALGLDAPPELLLGTNAMNHWGAWLMQEEVVSAHIVPPLQLLCDALTTQYLRPVLKENGWSDEDADQYVVWYNVDDLIIRPNKAADAQNLYDKGELTGAALRRENGFDESDAPLADTHAMSIAAAFEMVKTDPGLLLRPGLDLLVKQLEALLDGRPLPAIDDAPPNIAGKAVAGPNVEDRDNPTIEPVSPPAPVPAAASGGPSSASASASNPKPVGTPRTLGKPAPVRGANGAPGTGLALKMPAMQTYRSAASLGIRGSLSEELQALENKLESADDEIYDMTAL